MKALQKVQVLVWISDFLGFVVFGGFVLSWAWNSAENREIVIETIMFLLSFAIAVIALWTWMSDRKDEAEPRKRRSNNQAA